MATPVEKAVETFIRAATDPDPAVRAALLEECFAADGRFVTRSREFRGPVALSNEITRFLNDPRSPRIRLTSVVDARGTTFRYRAVAEFSDGTSAESFDAGEINASGQISLILTFAGPLADSAQPSEG